MITPFVLSVLILAQGDSSLKDFESRAPKPGATATESFAFTAELAAFVEKNGLKTAEDYLKASELVRIVFFDFRNMRLRYEWLTTAAAKGSEKAQRSLAACWDGLMVSLGRGIRFDAEKMLSRSGAEDFFLSDPAPKSIAAIWMDPDSARKAASSATDNEEMTKIVDADQKARENFQNMTSDQLLKMMKEDKGRNSRTRAIVKSGELKTANDFANAALVMQHSTHFDGFQLAHELAVCSMLLGDKGTGRWLIAASYDRMLNSIGHEQRYGTQYGPEGFKLTDTTGMCDDERLSLGCPTLEEAKKRKLG